MKIIYNNIIPPTGFLAINIFGNLFVRSKYKERLETNEYYRKKVLNHESIHTEQMKDFAHFLPTFVQQYFGGIVFYIIYFFEWLFRVLFTKDCFSHNAYRNISFEKEAYNNESNLDYIKDRSLFAEWFKI